jgi:polar amino acid transport system substrate-binding protein
MGWHSAITAVESGQADGIIGGMVITDERKSKFDFSDGYYQTGVVMAVKAGNNNIKSYDDLAGKKVALKTGTQAALIAESIKDKYDFLISYFDETPFMYENVKSGNAAACFEDYPVVEYGIDHGSGMKIVGRINAGSECGFAVLKGKNQKLVELFNDGLKNIKENREYDNIIGKYIKEDVRLGHN